VKIVLIGASGRVGSCILNEALSRGHQVTAIVRHPEGISINNPGLTIVRGDVLKDKVEDLVQGYDAVISAYNPGLENPDINNRRIEGTRRIIAGVKKSGVKRLLVVGGAGSLEVSPGVQLIDTMKLPDQVMVGILATRDTLNLLRAEKNLEWTFLSPAASMENGERTGHFRIGKDQLLKNEKGESKISFEDLAVAMVDELEHPQHVRERFTVAY
jgi:putative NADH-flavin reductase